VSLKGDFFKGPFCVICRFNFFFWEYFLWRLPSPSTRPPLVIVCYLRLVVTAIFFSVPCRASVRASVLHRRRHFGLSREFVGFWKTLSIYLPSARPSIYNLFLTTLFFMLFRLHCCMSVAAITGAWWRISGKLAYTNPCWCIRPYAVASCLSWVFCWWYYLDP